jgi:hypothetical protein
MRLGLPGVCEDDVVARGVSAATTWSGRACEAEFEDHVGGVVCRESFYGMLVNVVVLKPPLSLPLDYSHDPNPCTTIATSMV